MAQATKMCVDRLLQTYGNSDILDLTKPENRACAERKIESTMKNRKQQLKRKFKQGTEEEDEFGGVAASAFQDAGKPTGSPPSPPMTKTGVEVAAAKPAAVDALALLREELNAAKAAAVDAEAAVNAATGKQEKEKAKAQLKQREATVAALTAAVENIAQRAAGGVPLQPVDSNVGGTTDEAAAEMDGQPRKMGRRSKPQ
jgi:hypothetical protein